MSSLLSIIGGSVSSDVEMPGRGCVCSTKPGLLLELTTVPPFVTGSSWKSVKSGSEAESTDRRGEAVVVVSRVRNR